MVVVKFVLKNKTTYILHLNILNKISLLGHILHLYSVTNEIVTGHGDCHWSLRISLATEFVIGL